MGTHPTKALNNIYCKARMAASKWNDTLASREGAAEQMGISKDSLTDYELGLCKVVPVDKVVIMAEAYNAPDLLQRYCHDECPIGKNIMPEVEDKTIESLALNSLCAFKNAEKYLNELTEIAADGVIDESEQAALQDIKDFMQRILKIANEFQIFLDKQAGGGHK